MLALVEYFQLTNLYLLMEKKEISLSKCWLNYVKNITKNQI